MNKNEIMKFVNENPVFFLATTKDNIPYGRAMMTAIADEKGIFFSTDVKKDVCKQISANPNVELCYFNAEKNIQIRLSGAVESVNDQAIKQEIVGKFPFLEGWIEKEGYEAMAIFCFSSGKVTTWSMDNKESAKTYTDF